VFMYHIIKIYNLLECSSICLTCSGSSTTCLTCNITGTYPYYTSVLSSCTSAC
jgi:hypothetical protein